MLNTQNSFPVTWSVKSPAGFCEKVCLFVFGATAPPVVQGLLIHEVSISHTITHRSR
jgi:hypothetical protein